MTLKITRTLSGFDWSTVEDGTHSNGSATCIEELTAQLDAVGHDVSQNVINIASDLAPGETETFAARGSEEEQRLFGDKIKKLDEVLWAKFMGTTARIEKDIGIKTMLVGVVEQTDVCENGAIATEVTHEWRDGNMKLQLIGLFDPTSDYVTYTLRSGDYRVAEPYVTFYVFEQLDEEMFPFAYKYFRAKDLAQEKIPQKGRPVGMEIVQNKIH
jgi:hypothetical protein